MSHFVAYKACFYMSDGKHEFDTLEEASEKARSETYSPDVGAWVVSQINSDSRETVLELWFDQECYIPDGRF